MVAPGTIYFFLWVIVMALSIWALEAARMFARRAAKAQRHAPQLPPNPPSVALILPIKGIEEETVENLQALLQLSYPRLRLLFAVESEDDPVVNLLKQAMADLRAGQCELVVAGTATTRGQKIHNQLAAVEKTTAADEVLVFLDADARPHDRWLPALIGALQGPNVAASTGYRLYVPKLKRNHANIASSLVSVINAKIAALLGPAARNQAWGGSMAIRRKDFFDLGVHAAWQRALSDDHVLTHQVKRVHKKEIHFAHWCFVASTANFTAKSLFEFAPRQYKITRICAPFIWLAAVFGASLYVVAFIAPLVLWSIGLFMGKRDDMLLVLLAGLYVVNMIRGFLLLRGSIAALPEQSQRLKAAAFWYTLGFPFIFFVDLLALAKSAFGRTIHWRGIRYTMLSPTQTIVHRPPAEATPTPLRPEPTPTHELVGK